MSIREHPGRLCTKSAPNAWNGVTRPESTGGNLAIALNSHSVASFLQISLDNLNSEMAA
jgi:hypothetical protein